MIRAALIAIIGAGFCGSANGQITTVPSVGTGMNFQVQSGGGAATQSLTVSTSFGPTTLMISVPANQTWLTVEGRPAGQLLFVNTPATITVAVSPAGYPQQTTLSQTISIVIIGQPASQIAFPVTATVGAASILTSNPTALTFTAVQGAAIGSLPSTVVDIMSTGAQLSYNVSTSTQAGGSWLLVSATAGTTGISSFFQVRVNLSALAPANYMGTIVVQSTTTSDLVTIPVTLTVSPALSATPAPSTLILLLIGAVLCGIWLRFRDASVWRRKRAGFSKSDAGMTQ